MQLDPEGSAPLAHLSLLAHHPERLLAIRLAMAQRIGPESTVLVVGCGALGTLAITAARLGARRVVGLDGGPLPMAQRLADENRVGDRVSFLKLDDARAGTGPFDVILGMVHMDHPCRDLARQRVMARAAARFAHPTTIFIPDRARLTVAGYDSRTPDATDETRNVAWVETIERVESTAGVSMRAVRFLVDAEWRRDRLGLAVPPLSPDARLTARFGFPDRNLMTRLTDREIVAETRYARAGRRPAYPASLEIPVIRAGRLDGVLWRQDLMAGDLLIRSAETYQPVDSAEPVIAGETMTLTLDDRWRSSVPMTIASS